MKPEEWLACRDPRIMLVRRELGSKDLRRKMRLFLCGCCRLIWPTLPDDRCREAVEVGERLADGRAGPAEVSEAHARALAILADYRFRSAKYHAVMASIGPLAMDRSLVGTAIRLAEKTREASRPARRIEVVEAQCDLIRDLFGDPSQPEAFEPDWLTPESVERARDIYDHRDDTKMPALGDALEAAGCSNVRILDHCRGPGPHHRGCWVVDAVTGRA